MALTLKQTRFYQSLSSVGDREIGIELFFDASGKHNGYRALLGNKSTVPTWGTSSVFAHTHPIQRAAQDNLKISPPSSVDYHRALWDYYAGVEWQMVFEHNRCWAYRPNTALLSFIETVDPEVRKHVTRRQTKMTYRGGSVSYMTTKLDDVSETLLRNISIDNALLKDGDASIEEYITQIGMCVDGESRGFDVVHVASDEFKPLSIPTPSVPRCKPSGVLLTTWDTELLRNKITQTLTYSWVMS